MTDEISRVFALALEAAVEKQKKPAPKPRRRSSVFELPLLTPCPSEGAVTSTCLTCNSERKHERQCFHPNGVRDTCTRGNEKSTLQACNTCPDRPIGPRPAGWQSHHLKRSFDDV